MNANNMAGNGLGARDTTSTKIVRNLHLHGAYSPERFGVRGRQTINKKVIKL